MMCYPPFFIDVKGGENIGKEQREDAWSSGELMQHARWLSVCWHQWQRGILLSMLSLISKQVQDIVIDFLSMLTCMNEMMHWWNPRSRVWNYWKMIIPYTSWSCSSWFMAWEPYGLIVFVNFYFFLEHFVGPRSLRDMLSERWFPHLMVKVPKWGDMVVVH